MKKLFLSLIILCISVNMYAVSGTHIIMTMTSTMQGISGKMEVYHSATGVRNELTMNMAAMPNGSMKTVTLVKASAPGKVYRIMDDKRMFTEDNDNTQQSNSNPQITVLGNEKIGNYNCKHVKVVDGKNKYDMWLSTDVANYQSYQNAWNGTEYMGNSAMTKQLKAKGVDGFPVKVIFVDKQGTFTLQLQKLETKDLNSSLFAIPAGYKQTSSSPNMPAGMDMQNMQNMTPAQQQEMIKNMQKQYGK